MALAGTAVRALFWGTGWWSTARRPFAPGGSAGDVSTRLYPDRTAHRGGDHRAVGGHCHPKVLQHEGEGVHRRREIRPAQPGHGGRGVFLRQREVHHELCPDGQLPRIGGGRAGGKKGHPRGGGWPPPPPRTARGGKRPCFFWGGPRGGRRRRGAGLPPRAAPPTG